MTSAHAELRSPFHGVEAVVFDYGNTLIEFSRRQIEHCDDAFATALEHHCGRVDRELLRQLRDQDRMAGYLNGYVESTLPTICASTVRALFGAAASDEVVTALVERRIESFIECISAEPEAVEVLETLSAKGLRLGLLSNYPCSRSIRGSLESAGLLRFFDVVVVSGDVGFVKPHPRLYETVLSQLGVSADAAVHVGDNWLADVQGAKRAGLRCVHMQRWAPPEHFDREPGHHEPDASIQRLAELLPLLVDCSS